MLRTNLLNVTEIGNVAYIFLIIMQKPKRSSFEIATCDNFQMWQNKGWTRINWPPRINWQN